MNDRRIQKEKDDRLADFADRLLAGEIGQDALGHELDSDLKEMEDTLQQFRKAYPARATDQAMQNRIRARLSAEWQKNQSPTRNAQRRSILTKRTWSVALGIGAVAIIVLLVTFLPPGQTIVSGAAGTGSLWIPLTIFIIVIAMLGLWQLRKK